MNHRAPHGYIRYLSSRLDRIPSNLECSGYDLHKQKFGSCRDEEAFGRVAVATFVYLYKGNQLYGVTHAIDKIEQNRTLEVSCQPDKSLTIEVLHHSKNLLS